MQKADGRHLLEGLGGAPDSSLTAFPETLRFGLERQAVSRLFPPVRGESRAAPTVPRTLAGTVTTDHQPQTTLGTVVFGALGVTPEVSCGVCVPSPWGWGRPGG